MRIAAGITPSGFALPSKATVIPSKPSPALKAGSNLPIMLNVSTAPATPATAPPIYMLNMMVFLTEIPAYHPAFLFLPIVSILNPVVVFLMIHQSVMESPIARKNPRGRPNRSGI